MVIFFLKKPENARKLRGLVWRGDERIKSKDDIFPPEENEDNEKISQSNKSSSRKRSRSDENPKRNFELQKKTKKIVQLQSSVFLNRIKIKRIKLYILNTDFLKYQAQTSPIHWVWKFRML
jgi:hypothetical protein